MLVTVDVTWAPIILEPWDDWSNLKLQGLPLPGLVLHDPDKTLVWKVSSSQPHQCLLQNAVFNKRLLPSGILIHIWATSIVSIDLSISLLKAKQNSNYLACQLSCQDAVSQTDDMNNGFFFQIRWTLRLLLCLIQRITAMIEYRAFVHYLHLLKWFLKLSPDKRKMGAALECCWSIQYRGEKSKNTHINL